jgi:ATP-dependent DNA helicase PIF1
MIEKFLGNEKVHCSINSMDDDKMNNYPLDFLNSITPNGLPPHELKVKKTALLILVLTMLFAMELGWSLEVQNNSIDAEIVNGQHA